QRSASSAMPTDAAMPLASAANAGGNGGGGSPSKSARVGSYLYVLPFQWRPGHSMRTCIFPPPRTTGTYAGTAPSTSARHASTSARCSSRPRYCARWNAPGAISTTRTLPLATVRIRLALLLVVVLGVARHASAHPAPFSYVDLRVQRDVIEGTI